MNNQTTGEPTAFIEELQRKLELQAAELDLSKSLVSKLLDNVSEVFFSVQMVPPRLTHISASCQKVYGYTAEEFMGNPNLWKDVSYPGDREAVEENFNKLQKGLPVTSRTRIIHKDKSIRWLETTKTPTLDKNGKLIRIDGVNKEITEQGKTGKIIGETDHALQFSENKFQMFFENSLYGLLIAKTDATFHRVNRALCEMTGYTKEEFSKLTLLDVTVQDQDLENALKTRKEKGSFHGILKMKRKDGAIIDVEISSAFLRDETGKTYAYASCRDVTEKLSAEKQIARNEANLNALINGTNDAIFALDRNYKLIALNKSFFDRGYLYAGIKFKPGDDFFNDTADSDRRWWWRQHLEKAFKGQQFKIEERFEFEGLPHYSEISFTPVMQQNEVTGVVCFSRDITQKKLDEERLANSENRFRALIENSNDIIALIGSDGSMQYVSPAAKTVLGYELGDRAGRDTFENVHPDDKERLMSMFASVMANPGSSAKSEWRHRHRNGSWLWMEGIGTNLMLDPAVNALVNNFRDITDRKVAEQKLEAAANELSQIFNNVEEGLFAMDMTTRQYLQVSAGCEKIYGYPVSDFFANSRLWYEAIHPDDKIIVDRNDDKINRGERITMEFRITRKNLEVRWVEAKIIPTLNEAGVIARVDGIVKDITARKKTEEELQLLNHSLEKKVAERTAQLKDANKTLESFSYSVAHDLQAPLRILKGYADLLQTEHNQELNPEGQRLLAVIMNYAGLMSQLISDLLNFSQVTRASLSVKEIDNNRLVKEVIENVKQVYPDMKAVINLHDLGYFRCDRNLVKQVWQNLVSNAVKYSRKNAHPVIEIGTEQRNGQIIYYIKDNGVGFDMQYASRLFEVFQRLHRQTEFEGTGVGLALASRIIAKHGGKIWAKAEINKGAAFYFTLSDEIVGV